MPLVLRSTSSNPQREEGPGPSSVKARIKGSLRLPVWAIPFLWTLVFGMWGLSRQNSVWRDEAATWQVACRPAGQIWDMLGQVDAVHGCYYLLMHVLFECFGSGTTTLRLPSVLAGAVAAACLTVVGHRLAGFWAAQAAGLTLGLLPVVQFHLQEGRPYALVMAGAAMSTLLLTTVLQGRGRRRHWVMYAGALLACALLNWLSLLVLPAHAATLLWAKAGRRLWARWAVAAAAAAAGALPLVLFSRTQSQQVSWIPPLTWHMMIAPAVLLAIGGLGALLDRPRSGRLSAAAVGLPLLALPQLGLIGLSFHQPLYLERYVLFSMLGLSLLIGAGLGAAVRAVERRCAGGAQWLVPLVVVAAVLALLPESLGKRSPASRVDDVLSAAASVREFKEPGDAVLFVPAARRDTKLVSPEDFVGLQDIALAQSPGSSGTLKGRETEPDSIEAAMLQRKRIILVTDAPQVARPVSGRRDTVKVSVLRAEFRRVDEAVDRGRQVTVYERRRG